MQRFDTLGARCSVRDSVRRSHRRSSTMPWRRQLRARVAARSPAASGRTAPTCSARHPAPRVDQVPEAGEVPAAGSAVAASPLRNGSEGLATSTSIGEMQSEIFNLIEACRWKSSLICIATTCSCSRRNKACTLECQFAWKARTLFDKLQMRRIRRLQSLCHRAQIDGTGN